MNYKTFLMVLVLSLAAQNVNRNEMHTITNVYSLSKSVISTTNTFGVNNNNNIVHEQVKIPWNLIIFNKTNNYKKGTYTHFIFSYFHIINVVLFLNFDIYLAKKKDFAFKRHHFMSFYFNLMHRYGASA